jgi:hypothetical protein
LAKIVSKDPSGTGSLFRRPGQISLDFSTELVEIRSQ